MKTQREPIYTALLRGELDCHLFEIDTQAGTVFFQLVEQLEKHEGMDHPTNDIMKIRRITFFCDTAVSLNTSPTSNQKPYGIRFPF